MNEAVDRWSIRVSKETVNEVIRHCHLTRTLFMAVMKQWGAFFRATEVLANRTKVSAIALALALKHIRLRIENK